MKYLTQMEVESIIDGAYKARLNWGEFFSSLKTHAEEISPAMTNKLRKGIREILEELTIQSMIHGKMQTFPEYMRQHSIRLKDGFSQALKLRGEKDVKRKKCC